MGNTLRVYSYEEAKKLVPELERALRQMQEAARGLKEVKRRLAEARPGTPEHRGLETELRFLERALEADRAWLEGQGVLLRDLEEGIVDIPYKREGELVYLTWKPGEAEPARWHAVTAPPDESQPLDKGAP